MSARTTTSGEGADSQSSSSASAAQTSDTGSNNSQVHFSDDGKIARRPDAFSRVYKLLDRWIIDDTEESIRRGFEALSAQPKAKPSLRPDSTDQLWVATEKTFPALLDWLSRNDLMWEGPAALDQRERTFLAFQSLIGFMNRLNDVQSDGKVLRNLSDVLDTDVEAAQQMVLNLSFKSVQSILNNSPRIESRKRLAAGDLQWTNYRWNEALVSLDMTKLLNGTRSAVSRHKEHLQAEQEHFSKIVELPDPASMTIAAYQALDT